MATPRQPEWAYMRSIWMALAVVLSTPTIAADIIGVPRVVDGDTGFP
jgi:hypothetical protein